MLINIDDITLDEHTQPREFLESDIIQQYADDIGAGAKFPPVIVFRQNGSKWLADGWHRVMAAKKAGLNQIEADTKEGQLRDAILFSKGVNANHGLRRTNSDKRRAVISLLTDYEWSLRSDRWIAEHCSVSNNMVSALRKQMSSDDTGLHKPEQVASIQPSTEERAFFTEGYAKVRADYEEQVSQMQQPQPEDVSKFNKTNSNIEWAAWSWNPVTGCEFGCTYCYARDIANRFFKEGFKPTFHPERLAAPANTNPIVGQPGGSAVFVCSMADLFGDWVPNEWINPVIQSAKDNPQWTFIFLTKNPRRLMYFDFPDNAWVGTTVDRQARVQKAEGFMSKVKAKVTFFSCEPMLEELTFECIDVVDWIIIGGQSKTTQAPEFQPEWGWVWKLTNDAYDKDVKVYWKPNLTVRPMEYPKC